MRAIVPLRTAAGRTIGRRPRRSCCKERKRAEYQSRQEARLGDGEGADPGVRHPAVRERSERADATRGEQPRCAESLEASHCSLCARVRRENEFDLLDERIGSEVRNIDLAELRGHPTRNVR